MSISFAVPTTVGFDAFPLEPTSFFAASVSIFTNISRVSGFLMSHPDIIFSSSVSVYYVILKMSDVLQKIKVRCCGFSVKSVFYFNFVGLMGSIICALSLNLYI